jgi:hypothetical protein
MCPFPPSRGPLEEAVKHRRLSSFTCFICATSLFTQQLSLPKRSTNVQLASARRSVPWFQGFKMVSWWFQGGFKVVSRRPPQRGLGREGAAGGRGGPDRRRGAWGGGAGRRRGALEEDISSSFPLLVTIASGGLKPPMKPP